MDDVTVDRREVAEPPRPSCCDDPKPRILERNGRQFCANCKRYLDTAGRRQDDPPA